MRRSQGRDVDRVVAGIAIDGDGVEAQAGGREVADDLEACRRPGTTGRSRGIDTVDADFFDLAKFGDDMPRWLVPLRVTMISVPALRPVSELPAIACQAARV